MGVTSGAPDRDVDLARTAFLCALRVIPMLWRHELHRRRDNVGATVELDDGRRFLVYRDTSSTAPLGPDHRPGDDELVRLAIWFRLWSVPPGARALAWLFERESILNTILYAGCSGYRTKLWTVDRSTSDYAGFYTWQGRAAAGRYQRYVTAVLRPLSVRGTVGGSIDDADAPPSWTVVDHRPSSHSGADS